MTEVKAWEEQTVIPTYEVGKPEKNPIFLEKRVYQGSSGKVYPYPTIDRIGDNKVEKAYRAVYLENEYLKVMILPELGGRIQRAYDKTNGYDFIYYNHVIKPALVGLLGPWISGGIEFNWPQHHRPTTYLPVDCTILENEDGSKSVVTHDVDQMYGTGEITKITLYPGKAYIEITGQLYNRTALPQTFLWWANPAVPVNENTQSIFPPDVHAVVDHGKRDVSRFPIATGVYYKKDYSEGVDISRYKNIPVPTSYMAEKSKYDFVGGYDYGREAGILHVADHHISPGKKQWTWGCGDFGKAWDRNLTDEDGPYVELMTGVYTDNQPDFTWLKPFEEKVFRQYFMPYKAVGQVKNATKDAAVHLSCGQGTAKVVVYATGVWENARIVLTDGRRILLDQETRLSPNDIFRAEIPWEGEKEEDLWLRVLSQGVCLAEYRPEPEEIPHIPDPAKAAEDSSEIMTNEELFLTGQHIEQYRHATYLPDPYYLEGLKRDPGDIRINQAYGQLLLRRGCICEAEGYFRKAIERLTMRNPNPYDSESYYMLGVDLFLQERTEEAYDAFFKATWSSEQQEMAFYYLAAIDARRGRLDQAMEHIERSLVKNAHNIKARGLKAYLLRRMGKTQLCLAWIKENQALDPFDFVSSNEQIQLAEMEGDHKRAKALGERLNQSMRGFREHYLMTARDYAEMGAFREAEEVLNRCGEEYPMLYYYRAWYTEKCGGDADELLRKAEACSPDYCFPNKLEDLVVLERAVEKGCCRKAPYYLGNLYYDKLQWEKAQRLWEISASEEPELLPVWGRYVEATGELSRIGYREEVESVLRTGQMSGISLLGLQDFPGQGTALVGMLNSHLEAKPFPFAEPEAFRSFFADRLPLVLLEKYTYENTETLTAPVRIANYGKSGLRGDVCCELSGKDFRRQIILPDVYCPQGELTDAGQIRFGFEEVSEPVRLELTVSVGEIRNSYPVWVYPPVHPVCPEGICVSECLDEKVRETLRAGGKVYLTPRSVKEDLPSSVQAQFTTDFWSVGTFAGQEGCMGQLIDDSHPLFRNFPTEFHTNWQWWPMAVQRAVILPEAVSAIITEMDSYAWLRPMAQLFEFRCGGGTVLFSSMGLQDLQQYPEARALLAAIYSYLDSDSFRPEQELSMEALEKMIRTEKYEKR